MDVPVAWVREVPGVGENMGHLLSPTDGIAGHVVVAHGLVRAGAAVRRAVMAFNPDAASLHGVLLVTQANEGGGWSVDRASTAADAFGLVAAAAPLTGISTLDGYDNNEIEGGQCDG